MADFLSKSAKKSARVYVDATSPLPSTTPLATIEATNESNGHQSPPKHTRRTIAAVTRQLSHDISTEQLFSDHLIDGKVADEEEEEEDKDHSSDDEQEDNNSSKRPLSASRARTCIGSDATATAKPELYRIESHSALSSLEYKSKPPGGAASPTRPMAKPHKLAPLPGSPTLARNKPDAIQIPSPDVCSKCREGTDMPPVHCAAFSGHVACLQALLPSKSPDREAESWLDKKRRTPLFYACAANRIECVDLLLRCHTEWLEVGDKQLDSPVHVCCFFGWDACLRRLLDAGANPHVRNAKGFKPSHIAKTEQCLELLLSFGDDLLQGDKLGRTPLFVACARDRSACVEFLCAWNHRSRSWMLEQEDQRGDRPIHAAACNGSAASLEILLRYGADPLIANAKGLTPKDLAAANRHDKCVELLSKAEADQSSGTTWFAPANAATAADVGVDASTEWVECWDNDSGQPFYYNNLSGKCQWEAPEGFTPQLYAQPQLQQNQEEEQEDDGGEYVWVKKKKQTVTVVTGKDTEWIAVQDPTSRAIYYKNTRTGQSQWEEPDAVRQLQTAVGAKASQEASRIWEELEQARTALAAAIAREKRRQLAVHKQTLDACKLHVRQRKEDMAKREEQARLAQLLPRSSFIRRKKQSMMMKVSAHNSNARKTTGMKSSLAVLDEQHATAGPSCDDKVEDICSREPALDIFLSTYMRLHGVRDLQVLTAEKRFCNCLFHYYVALADPVHMKGLSKSQFRVVLRDALIIPSTAAASSSSSSHQSLVTAGLTMGPPLKLHVIDLIFAQAERAVALEASSSPSSPSAALLHHRQAAATAVAPGGEMHLGVAGFTTAMQIVRERAVTQAEQNDESSEIEDDEEWFLLTFLVPLALKLGARLLTQIRQCKELELQVAASSRALALLTANRLAIQALHRHYSSREPTLKMLSFRGLAQFALDFGLVANSGALPALQFLLEAVHWISGNAHTEIVSFEKFQQVLTMLPSLPLPSGGLGSATSTGFSTGPTLSEDKVVEDLAALFQRLARCPAIHLVDSQLLPTSFVEATTATPSNVNAQGSDQSAGRSGLPSTASMASLFASS